MTVCLEKSRETARDLSVTINYSKISPAEAQGKIKVELLVKTTILCRHYKGVLLVQVSVCSFIFLYLLLLSLHFFVNLYITQYTNFNPVVADVDFTSGSVTLNFPASENVICTDIDITDDLLALEGNERFMVDFAVIDPEVIAGPSSIVTIIDNDGKRNKT